MSSNLLKLQSRNISHQLHVKELLVVELLLVFQPLAAAGAEIPPEPEVLTVDPPPQDQVQDRKLLAVPVSSQYVAPTSLTAVDFTANVPSPSIIRAELQLEPVQSHLVAQSLRQRAIAKSQTNKNEASVSPTTPNSAVNHNRTQTIKGIAEAQEKINVLENQTTGDYLIVNNDLPTDNPEIQSGDSSDQANRNINDPSTGNNNLIQNSKISLSTIEVIENQLPVELNSLDNTKTQNIDLLFDHQYQLINLFPSSLDTQENKISIRSNNTEIAQQLDDNEIELNLELPPLEELQEDKNSAVIDWQKTVRQAISSTVQKYTYIVDPTDRLTFAPESFNPDRFEDYSTSDFRFAANNPVLNSFTYAHFPEDKQFLWVVDQNKIVIETEGMHGGIIYQGHSNRTQGTLTALLKQRFLGVQTIASIPQTIDELVGEADQFIGVTAIAGSVTTPEGIKAGSVILNSGIDLNADNVIHLNNLLPVIGNPNTGSTSSPKGGGSLFTQLDATNAPKIMQGFPTNDLSPLINGINFKLDALIPNANLDTTGISFSDPLTNIGYSFTAPLTSRPGIHTAQPNKGMSDGLLNLSVNPFLTNKQREIAYLDSIFWFPLGQISETLETDAPILQDKRLLPADRRNLGQNLLDIDDEDWYRLYFTASHKRTAVEFDHELPQSKYTSLFSAPGISFNTSFHDADGAQFINATLGLSMGYLFDTIKPEKIEKPLKKAYQEFEAGESFSALQIAATNEEQKQLNQRLNQNLQNSFRFSELEQLSGDFSEGKIDLTDSNITHIRTGLYKRRVEFIRGGLDAFEGSFGTAFFSKLDTSEEDFGNLVFQGVLEPLEDTSIQKENQSSAADIIFQTADNKKIVAHFDSTTYPVIGGKAADIAFDHIEISRVYNGRFDVGNFLGTLSLPSIEFLHTGTHKKLNYGLSIGTWFNVDPKIAGSIYNNIGLQESSIGAYARASANLLLQDIQFDENKQFVRAITNVPFFDLNWNSDTNRLNAFKAQIGHSFSGQDRDKFYALTAALTYIPNGINNVIPESSNGELIGLVNTQLTTKGGLDLQSNFEIGKKIFVDIEATQKLFKNFSAGLYFKNSTTNNIGLDTRIDESSYGLVLKYKNILDNISISAKIGHSDNGFDAELTSVLNFNF